MINKVLKPIFWDIDFKTLDSQTHADSIIARVLEYGDEKQVEFMRNNYDREQIIQVLKSTRLLSEKSANFWTDYYDVPKEEVKCLNKSFLTIRKSVWPY